MKLWRRPRPAVKVEVPIPRTEVPMEGPTEGELAREVAELELTREMKRTEAVKAETPWFESMGEVLGRLRARNHLREDILGQVRGG